MVLQAHRLWHAGGSDGVARQQSWPLRTCFPEGPGTQYSWTLVPKTLSVYGFWNQSFQYWVLEPSRFPSLHTCKPGWSLHLSRASPCTHSNGSFFVSLGPFESSFMGSTSARYLCFTRMPLLERKVRGSGAEPQQYSILISRSFAHCNLVPTDWYSA